MCGGGGGGAGGGMGGGGTPWGSIGASVGANANALYGMYQNRRAARAMSGRQKEANELYREQFAGAQEDYAPYQQAGTSALDALMRTYGLGKDQNGVADYSGFENSPDYAWALQQGQQSLDRSAAAKGRLYSGAQMQASQRFGQGLATQYLGNYRSGLQGISGQGLNATNALSNYRMNYGNQLGQGITNLGDIQAARYLGSANIYNNMHNDLMNTWGGGSTGGQNGGYGGYGGGGGSSYGQQQAMGYGVNENDYSGPWGKG